MKASQLEVVRLKTILRLEGTAEGKIRRRFDLALWPVLAMTDPIPALNEAARLVRLDKSRWEAPALAGIFHAQTGAFAESVKALDEAVQLAPEDRRANLQLAAGAARREAAFTEQVKKAGLLWEKQQYRPSATAYEAAWTAIPARFDIGMQAATGFLMADQVAAAVKILSLMRESAGGEPAAKVTAMLRELGAVSEEARAASGKPQAENPSAPEAALPARIRTLIGSLASDEVELVAKSAPPLLSDTTTVTPIPDEEVTGGRTDMAFLTTDSIFAMYRRDLTRAAERAGSAAPPAALTAVTPAALITRELPPPPDRPAAAPDAPSRPAPAPERTTAETPAAPAAGSPDSALCRVFVRSKTPGLALFVNGQATGKVTPAEFSWVKGEYEVGIEVGGEIHKVKVSVTEGSFLTLPW